MSLHFDKYNTFCISLESKPDRWARMEARFAYFGIECTRWLATTPSQVSDRFYDYLNGGQRACGQSHINIWRHMIDRDLPYALILEDDAMFCKEWLTKLPIHNYWDLFMLNASEPVLPKEQWVKIQDQYLTGAYIISQNGAKWILDNFSGCYGSSDWMTSRLQTRGHSYSYFPWLVIQEGTESCIGSGFEADHAKVVRCLAEAQYDIGNYI